MLKNVERLTEISLTRYYTGYWITVGYICFIQRPELDEIGFVACVVFHCFTIYIVSFLMFCRLLPETIGQRHHLAVFCGTHSGLGWLLATSTLASSSFEEFFLVFLDWPLIGIPTFAVVASTVLSYPLGNSERVEANTPDSLDRENRSGDVARETH